VVDVITIRWILYFELCGCLFVPYLLTYIPSSCTLPECIRENQLIRSLLQEINRLHGIKYEILELPRDNIEAYSALEAQIYEKLKRYSRRISKVTDYLRSIGVNVYPITIAQKFRSRGGRGYIYITDSLIVYDDQGILWAGKGREISTFLEALKRKGASLLSALSNAAGSTRYQYTHGVKRGNHEDVVARYVAKVFERESNVAVILEYPVGAILFANVVRKELESKRWTIGEVYLKYRYREIALRALSHAFRLRAVLLWLGILRDLNLGKSMLLLIQNYLPQDPKYK